MPWWIGANVKAILTCRNDTNYAQRHQYQSKNPSRRHNRGRGSNNSFTRKRHYYSSQSDDDVIYPYPYDTSMMKKMMYQYSYDKLQQMNLRLLFLAELILAATTWVNNSNSNNNNNSAVFRDSTAVQTDEVQRIMWMDRIVEIMLPI
eukprot:scaffold45673_cov70-Cyclotella_meneghiniana.AAC.1